MSFNTHVAIKGRETSAQLEENAERETEIASRP
jgi:hypothetical protein